MTITNDNLTEEETAQVLNCTPRVSKKTLRDWVQSLSMSAEDKGLLYSLCSITVRIGQKIVRLGQKVLEILYEVVKHFPGTCAGVLIGLGLWWIIALIPFYIGYCIGAVVGPILTLCTAGIGLLSDVGLSVKALIEGILNAK